MWPTTPDRPRGRQLISAGFGGVRALLKVPEHFARIDGLIMADSIYCGYTGDPKEHRVNPALMEGFRRFAVEAAAGRKAFLLSHSALVPDGYASTGEVADFLIDAVGGDPRWNRSASIGPRAGRRPRPFSGPLRRHRLRRDPGGRPHESPAPDQSSLGKIPGDPGGASPGRERSKTMNRSKRSGVLVALAMILAGQPGEIAGASDDPAFRVGSADADITPPPGIPMWGYGARHDMPAEGTLDPLMAQAIVIAAGDDKLAIVGTDLGRGPTAAMMTIIRKELAEKAGIRHVLISGSHSHHGPVIELIDEPGLGRGKFDAAVKYSQELPGRLVRGHPRRRQGPPAGPDRDRHRVGEPEPEPAHQARAEGHRPHARGDPLRRSGRQADRRARQLRRASGHDRREAAQVLGRLSGLPQGQGRGRAGDEVRLHAGRRRRHEPESGRRPVGAEKLRPDGRRPRDRDGPVDPRRGPGAPVDQGHGQHVPVQDAGRPQEPDGLGHVRAELLPRDHPRVRQSSSAILWRPSSTRCS